MPGEYPLDEVRGLWKELGAEPPRISPEQLRVQADRLRALVRRRSAIGRAASVAVMFAFGIFLFAAVNWLQRIGAGLTVVGAAYILVQLRMARARVAPSLGEVESIRYYRAELERQRDFHQGRWFWSRLVIFVPGPVLFGLGEAQAIPDALPFVWFDLAAIAILTAMAIVWNLRLARKLQQRIDALDAALGSK